MALISIFYLNIPNIRECPFLYRLTNYSTGDFESMGEKRNSPVCTNMQYPLIESCRNFVQFRANWDTDFPKSMV